MTSGSSEIERYNSGDPYAHVPDHHVTPTSRRYAGVELILDVSESQKTQLALLAQRALGKDPTKEMMPNDWRRGFRAVWHPTATSSYRVLFGRFAKESRYDFDEQEVQGLFSRLHKCKSDIASWRLVATIAHKCRIERGGLTLEADGLHGIEEFFRYDLRNGWESGRTFSRIEVAKLMEGSVQPVDPAHSSKTSDGRAGGSEAISLNLSAERTNEISWNVLPQDLHLVVKEWNGQELRDDQLALKTVLPATFVRPYRSSDYSRRPPIPVYWDKQTTERVLKGQLLGPTSEVSGEAK